jgi:hypothetical protein
VAIILIIGARASGWEASGTKIQVVIGVTTGVTMTGTVANLTAAISEVALRLMEVILVVFHHPPRSLLP